jgi:hypothetical protein
MGESDCGKPKSKDIPSLFDDINEVQIHGKTQLLYPHQIKTVANSEESATVLQSYYKGFYWLVEAEFEGQKIYIKHATKIEDGTPIYLSVNA